MKSQEMNTDIRVLEETVANLNLTKIQGGNFERCFALASGIRELRKLITAQMMSDIMELQGTSLGFKTDRDKDNGYPVDVVKEVLIEAVLRGAAPIGNEFNIIAGRCYLTKEFFVRALREMPELENLILSAGVPVLGGGGALVPYEATWTYRGQEFRISRSQRKLADGSSSDNRICVRVNAGMGADGILGKAEKKIRAQILSLLTNTTFSDEDDGDGQAMVREIGQAQGSGTKSEQLAARLSAAAAEGDRRATQNEQVVWNTVESLTEPKETTVPSGAPPVVPVTPVPSAGAGNDVPPGESSRAREERGGSPAAVVRDAEPIAESVYLEMLSECGSLAGVQQLVFDYINEKQMPDAMMRGRCMVANRKRKDELLVATQEAKKRR